MKGDSSNHDSPRYESRAHDVFMHLLWNRKHLLNDTGCANTTPSRTPPPARGEGDLIHKASTTFFDIPTSVSPLFASPLVRLG